jgi:hypothetical protein
MRDPAFVRDCVITIISDDYETFETILVQTKRLAESRGILVNDQEVADALQEAIVEGLAEAYVLSPHEPHSQKITYSAEHLHELWFYVTPSGKTAAKSIPELSGENY